MRCDALFKNIILSIQSALPQRGKRIVNITTGVVTDHKLSYLERFKFNRIADIFFLKIETKSRKK